jgi:indole-3-glycerol phosphate synthase
MKQTQTILDEILVHVRRELAAAQAARPTSELRHMIADAPPVRSMSAALKKSFGLIAEIKDRSPSQGEMRKQNIAAAPAAYEQSKIVRAISVLTNASHFGMSLERLRAVRAVTTKPILRKDFIFDEYQILEARAFGADAVLLMANLLDADELQKLFTATRALGMDALFECHDREQISQVPAGAEIYGINSRTFAVGSGQYAAAREQRAAGAQQDFTTDLSRFDIGKFLPPAAVRVAESGIHPHTIAAVRDQQNFHAALVGTSLLVAEHGVERELTAFETALAAQ